MVYLNVKYVIATGNYEFFNTGTDPLLTNFCVTQLKGLYVLDK